MTSFTSSPVTNKKPAGASIFRRACLETGHPHPGLVAAGTATKVDMKARQADVRTTTVAVAGAMTGVVTAAIAITRSERLVATMTGVVAAAIPMARPVRLVAMTGIVTAAMTATMARRVMLAAMTGVAAGVPLTIAGLTGGRSEDGKTDSDSEEGDDLFHDELGFGLNRCRQTAACKSDAASKRLFSSSTLFSLL